MSQHRIVALVGAPNSGKTTLYNWLTASQFKTVNYPGATVEFSIGLSAERLGAPAFKVYDTPGVHSLDPLSEDERVTLGVLNSNDPDKKVNAVIVVVDGTQLSRHLPLVRQVQESGVPFVIAVTMADLLRQSGAQVNASLFAKEFGAQVCLFDGVLGAGLIELAQMIRELPQGQVGLIPTWSSEERVSVQKEMSELAHNLIQISAFERRQIYARTRQIDAWLLHPLFGILLFALVMSGLFYSVYSLSGPLMDLTEGLFKYASDTVLALSPDSLWADFVANGVIASFGSIFVFVPQIAILFVGLGLLESTGYLARAATLVDRPFSKIGLSGRSFVPVLSGFACAVPAMMATRNLSSSRERWLANFIIPLMTCSARLPVYALLLGFLFADAPAWKPALALSALYFGSLLIGAFVASILNRMLKRGEASMLMMELPLYRRPRLRVILSQTWQKTLSYVSRAGPVIFVLALLIWGASSFPKQAPEATANQVEMSYLARAGKMIDPVFEPMGVDWRVGVGLLSAFAAREVFVSTLAVVFHVTNEDTDLQEQGLLVQMKNAKNPQGEPLFTVATVCGLLIFFMIALQCMSTFAIAVKESGSMSFAVWQLVSFNLFAYLLAVMVVQGLRAIGIA